MSLTYYITFSKLVFFSISLDLDQMENKYFNHKMVYQTQYIEDRRKEIEILTNNQSYSSVKLEKLQTRRMDKKLKRQLGKLPKSSPPDGYSSEEFSDEEEFLLDDIFADVSDKYSKAGNVLEFFKKWRDKEYSGSSNLGFVNCYVNDCLGKILPIYVRFEMMIYDGNPLRNKNLVSEAFLNPSSKINSLKNLISFITDDDDSENHSKLRNTDLAILNSVTTRSVIPFLVNYTKNCFDPLSKSQCQNLLGNLNSLLFLPIIRQKTKINLELITTIFRKFENCLENDCVIPASSENDDFVERQIWRNVKILENLLEFSAYFSRVWGVLMDFKFTFILYCSYFQFFCTIYHFSLVIPLFSRSCFEFLADKPVPVQVSLQH